MQAIRTQYFGPGNVRGSRIKATAAAGSLTVGYDHRLNLTANHRVAAEAFQAKLDWSGDGYGTLVSGCLPDGSWCHTMPGRDGVGDWS
jgi:hypothetical protein